MKKRFGKLVHNPNTTFHDPLGVINFTAKSRENDLLSFRYFKMDLFLLADEKFSGKECSFYLVNIKIPKEFHNVIIIKDNLIEDASSRDSEFLNLLNDEKIYTKEISGTDMGDVYVCNHSLGEDINDLFAVNIAINIAPQDKEKKWVIPNPTNDEKPYPATAKEIKLLANAPSACVWGMIYDGIKPKIFKFRNHFFLPLILTDGSIIYYAMESKSKLRKWINDVNALYYKLINQEENKIETSKQKKKEEIAEKLLIGGAYLPIIYDNILGIHITKDANLIIPFPIDDFDIVEPNLS